MLFAAIAAMADDAEQSLYVTMKDGTKAEFCLSSKPSITTSIVDMTLSIQWQNDDEGTLARASYDLLQVKDFLFGKSSTAVSTIQQSEGKLNGDYFIAPSGKGRITVSTIDGRLLPVNAQHNGESVIIDLRQLHKGVYVINYNSNSFKLQRP